MQETTNAAMYMSLKLSRLRDFREWCVCHENNGVVWERFTRDEDFNFIRETYVVAPSGDVEYTKTKNDVVIGRGRYKYVD